MPRQSKGARLWLRPPGGKATASPTPFGSSSTANDTSPQDALRAKLAKRKALAAYMAEKYHPSRHARDIDRIEVADVLSIYLEDCGWRVIDQPKLERCIGA